MASAAGPGSARTRDGNGGQPEAVTAAVAAALAARVVGHIYGSGNEGRP